mmetsp:Transcript_6404/g.7326  ORF Transcript_6404/g.7326 Transcript_6404/m.7326 type:complete len:312 (-) Transcript_6404:136-1071(-)
MEKKKQSGRRPKSSGEHKRSVNFTPAKNNRKHRKRKRTNRNEGGDEAPSHPFIVDETDHCETPIEAYQDIESLLGVLAKVLGKTRKTVGLYDPYFCDGAVKKRLGSFGFEKIYNECEDFYDPKTGPKENDYDVIITNPPYSSDHMERLFKYCTEAKKPYFLLLPHYVYTKPYFKLLQPHCTNDVGRGAEEEGPFFVAPGIGRRYTYLPPQWSNGHDKATTSPFPSFWYCNCFELNKPVLSQFRELLNASIKTKSAKASKFSRFKQKVILCESVNELPNELKGEFDPSKKRLNPKRRKKLAKLKAKMKFHHR